MPSSRAAGLGASLLLSTSLLAAFAGCAATGGSQGTTTGAGGGTTSTTGTTGSGGATTTSTTTTSSTSGSGGGATTTSTTTSGTGGVGGALFLQFLDNTTHAIVEPGVVVGFRYHPDCGPARIGANGILRTGTLIYGDVRIGDYFQSGHNTVIRAKVRMGDYAQAVQAIWSDNDFAVLMLCLGYYFGHRTMKAVFGGKKVVSMFEMTKLVSSHLK